MDASREGLFRGIGALVRERREGLGISQFELAASLHLSRNTIGNIENGRHGPSLVTLYELASALQVEPSQLLPRLHNDSLLENKLKLHGLEPETASSLALILNRRRGE